jgi:KRAB domain-containing zinc finger protein
VEQDNCVSEEPLNKCEFIYDEAIQGDNETLEEILDEDEEIDRDPIILGFQENETDKNTQEKLSIEFIYEEHYQVINDSLTEINEETKVQLEDQVGKDPITIEHLQKEKIQCSECEKLFSNHRKLKIHVARAHNKARQCEYCEFSTNNKADLLKHVKSSHIQQDSNSTELRICPDCGKILKGNNHLNFHIKTKHLKLTKYSCDLCDFKSYGKYEIRSHIIIHHLPLEMRKEFKCDLCPSVLTTAMSLKTHKTHKHSGLRPFSCFCGKSYALRETLKSHIRNVHNGERKYKCPHCNKGFNSNPRLNDHVNNTHGKKQEIPCDKCGKVFNSLRNLQTHSIYHSPPTLKCMHCKKMFYIKKNLREHEESNHLGVTHQCDVCNRSFQSTSGLRRHAKSHR